MSRLPASIVEAVARTVVNGTDAFHERRIKVAGDRVVAAMQAGDRLAARRQWYQFSRLVMSRSPAQVASMEQELFRRAA